MSRAFIKEQDGQDAVEELPEHPVSHNPNFVTQRGLALIDDEIETARSRAIWRDVRDCIPFADGTEKPVWRVSMPPSEGHKMVYTLQMEAAVEAFYDWQGGLIWLRLDGEPEAEAVRRLVNAHGGGHATLVRASPGVCWALMPRRCCASRVLGRRSLTGSRTSRIC